MSSTRGSGYDDLLSGINLEELKRNEAATRRIGQLEADKKPAAIVERLLANSALAVLDGSNMGLTSTQPLTISAAKREALRDSTLYHISEAMPVDIYLALRAEYQRRINQPFFDNSKKRMTGHQLDIIHQNITYESFGEFISKSKDKNLKNFLKKLPESIKHDIEEMPLCVFVAMNVGHSVSMVSLLSGNPDNSELARSANEVKLIDLSGIDFQNQAVIDYFFPKDKSGRPVCNVGRLQKVMSGMMDRQKQVCVDNRIDVVVGMPRGLASFLMNLQVKNGPSAAEQVKDAYWDAYFKMVSESPEIQFYINPIGQLSADKEAQLRVKYQCPNLVMANNVDIRSLVITLNDREYAREKADPSYKRKIVGYDNAGDQMGLLNESKLGRHWRVKGEGTTVGQDEFTNATTTAGITIKAADRTNILVAGLPRVDSHLTSAAAAAVSTSSVLSSASSSSSSSNINAVINEFGGTALSSAVIAGNAAEVKRLLADKNIQVNMKDYVNMKDFKGNTALGWAIAKAKPEIAILLIRANADIGVDDPLSRKQLATLITEAAKAKMPGWNEVKIAMDLKQATVESASQLQSPESERPSTARMPSSARERAKALRPSAGAATSGMFGSSSGWKTAQAKTSNDAEHSPPSPRKK